MLGRHCTWTTNRDSFKEVVNASGRHGDGAAKRRLKEAGLSTSGASQPIKTTERSLEGNSGSCSHVRLKALGIPLGTGRYCALKLRVYGQ